MQRAGACSGHDKHVGHTGSLTARRPTATDGSSQSRASAATTGAAPVAEIGTGRAITSAERSVTKLGSRRGC